MPRSSSVIGARSSRCCIRTCTGCKRTVRLCEGGPRSSACRKRLAYPGPGVRRVARRPGLPLVRLRVLRFPLVDPIRTPAAPSPSGLAAGRSRSDPLQPMYIPPGVALSRSRAGTRDRVLVPTGVRTQRSDDVRGRHQTLRVPDGSYVLDRPADVTEVIPRADVLAVVFGSGRIHSDAARRHRRGCKVGAVER
jgi:hypothetical protein